MDVLALLVSVAYWPGIAGAATTPRWALLALILPWVLRRQPINAVHIAGAVFVCWAVLTMAWNPAPLDGIGALFILGLLAMCFWLGGQIVDMRCIYVWAGVGLWVSSAVAMAQWLGYEPIRTVPGLLPSGLFVNGNFMAEAAALIVVAAVAERIWWLLPGLMPALLLPQARGAMLACAIGLAVHYRRHWWAIMTIGCIAIAAIVAYSAVKVGATDDRLAIWQATVNGITVFGHGVGSFWTASPAFELRTGLHPWPEYAHNEFLHIAFELGIVGLALVCVFGLTLAGPLDTSRLVLATLAVEMCFGFPLHVPVTAFIAMVVAGHAGGNRYVLRDLVVRRRRNWPLGLAGARP